MPINTHLSRYLELPIAIFSALLTIGLPEFPGKFWISSKTLCSSGETFDGPPTLERSGSEHRVGRLHPLVPEGREAW